MGRRVLEMLGMVGCLGVIATACGGSTGPAGPQGQAGAPGPAGGSGTASVSGIQPSTAFTARATHVTLSGYATSWTDATTLDFGPGVTVANVHAASATALVADLTVDPSAAIGPRDVVVNDTTKETYSKGFAIGTPASVDVQGTLAQGAIAEISVHLQDPTTPFDTTTEQNPITGITTYPNLNITVPAGVSATVDTATSNDLVIAVTIDVDAKVASGDFVLEDGPPGAADNPRFVVPGGFGIAARTATALGATPVAGKITKPYDSALYSYTPSAAVSVVDLTVSGGASGNAGFALLPSNGQFASLVGFYQAAAGSTSSVTATLLPTSADRYYLVYWDNTGATGAYTVNANTTIPADTQAATAADATMTGALVAKAMPFVLTGGMLTTGASADWVKVTTGPGDGGRALRVQTLGDPLTDVAVTILEADGQTPIGQGETGTYVDTTSNPIGASTSYYVVFAAGQIFDPSDGSYDGVIRVQ